MPSTIVGAQSGGVVLVSGNPYSGIYPQPGGLLLRLAGESSGNAYIAYSGGVTINSGGALASGGLRDGMEIRPGDAWLGVKIPPNGIAGIYATVAAAVSGQVRINWNVD